MTIIYKTNATGLNIFEEIVTFFQVLQQKKMVPLISFSDTLAIRGVMTFRICIRDCKSSVICIRDCNFLFFKVSLW